MKLRFVASMVLAAAVAGPARAETHTSLRVQLNIGNAPPPPVVIYQAAPQMMVVPHSGHKKRAIQIKTYLAITVTNHRW